MGCYDESAHFDAALVFPAAGADLEFSFSPEPGRTRVQGEDLGREWRHHFAERLPALFERTLVIAEAAPGAGALEWIFTGPRGGFTVIASPDRVRLVRRYYDSFGLNEGAPRRHPERAAGDDSVVGEGWPKRLTVRLDHRLRVGVLLDGKITFRQEFPLDVYRRQVVYAGAGPQPGPIRGRLEEPEPMSATVTVDPAIGYQSMLGFGGITTPAAHAELNAQGKQAWRELLAEYNLLPQREYPIGADLNRAMDNWDRIADATPHYHGGNFPNGEISDFDHLGKLRSLGGETLFEFREPPDWARTDWRDAEGKLHEGVADPEPYARAMVRYCQTHQDRTGEPPEIVGIQNEVQQPPEVGREMALAPRKALDEAGFRQVKIHSNDSSWLKTGIAGIRTLQRSPDAWATIDFAATHMYDCQDFFQNPDAFDPLLREWRDVTGSRPFLSTELCINHSRYQLDSYRLALEMGQIYHNNLTIADASAIFYCWLLLNVEQPSYGWTRSLFVPDPAAGGMPVASSNQPRVFGAYSRRVREGAIRVQATSSDPGLLVVAFSGENGDRTLIALNRSVEPKLAKVVWDGVEFREREFVSPYDPNMRVPWKFGDFTEGIKVEPGEILTLTTSVLNDGHSPAARSARFLE